MMHALTVIATIIVITVVVIAVVVGVIWLLMSGKDSMR